MGMATAGHMFSTLTSMGTPGREVGSAVDSTGGDRLVRALEAMEAARHPFPVSSTGYYRRRIKSERQAFRLQKEIVAVAAVIAARVQATALETGARSRMDTSRSSRVFPRVLSHRGPLDALASLWFPTDIPSAAYCCAQKQPSSCKNSLRMTALLVEVKTKFCESPFP
jgi:hypothetical protein